MKDAKGLLSLPPAPQRTSRASGLAYGKASGSKLDYRLYRVERGNVRLRAGQPVTTVSKFTTQQMYGKVSNSALTTSAQITPTSPTGFSQQGSTPNIISAPNFSFSASDTTHCTISWSNYASLRPDGTAVILPAGSLAISGLTASIKYFYFPFWSEAAKAIGFVNGTGVGTPKVAFTSGTDAALQTQNLAGNFPFGVISFTQPGAGTATGTSGSTGTAATGNAGTPIGRPRYQIFS